ncbi:BatD family protein [Rhodanobacter lindaniclasticus]
MDNGKASSSLTFGIALRPTHAGTLQIPAPDVDGQRTAPLSLQVGAQAPATSGAPNRNLFMEATVEPQRGYVGEQLIADRLGIQDQLTSIEQALADQGEDATRADRCGRRWQQGRGER